MLKRPVCVCLCVYIFIIFSQEEDCKPLTSPRTPPVRGAGISPQRGSPHGPRARRIPHRRPQPPPPRAQPGPSGATSHRSHRPATARRRPRGRGNPAPEGREGNANHPGPRRRRRVRGQERPSAPLGLRRRPAPPSPPARELPLPVRAAASGLWPLPHRSPCTCPRRDGPENRQPQPCSSEERADHPHGGRGALPWPARTCR